MRNLKKVLAFTLVFAFVLSLGASALAAKWSDEFYADWEDVTYKDAVKLLSVHDDGLNVFQGVPAGEDMNFLPKEIFSRAEMIAIAAIIDIGGNPDNKTLNELFPLDAARDSVFDDMEDHWAKAAVNYAYRVGYVSGDGTGSFNPDDKINADMFYSILLSLLGFEKQDMDGPDWALKVGTLMTQYGLRDVDVANFNITREEVAQVLYKALDKNIMVRTGGGTTALYSKTDKTLRGKLNAKGEAGAFTITGKVIKTKYAQLAGFTNNITPGTYLDYSVVIWNPGGIMDGRDASAHGNLWQLNNPDDSVVPVAMLGRWVTLDVVSTGVAGSHVRAAAGAVAKPARNNDIVGISVGSGEWKNGISGSAISGWYGWTNLPYWGTTANLNPEWVNRAAYIGYGRPIELGSATLSSIKEMMEWYGTGGSATDVKGDAWSHYWKAPYTIDGSTGQTNTKLNYGYAVRDVNLRGYTDVFLLEYVALRVSDQRDWEGKVRYNFLCGCEAFWQKPGDFENGTTLAAGDIIVGVYNAGRNGLVAAEKIDAVKGVRGHGINAVNFSGELGSGWYTLAESITGAASSLAGTATGEADWFTFVPYYGSTAYGISGFTYWDGGNWDASRYIGTNVSGPFWSAGAANPINAHHNEVATEITAAATISSVGAITGLNAASVTSFSVANTPDRVIEMNIATGSSYITLSFNDKTLHGVWDQKTGHDIWANGVNMAPSKGTITQNGNFIIFGNVVEGEYCFRVSVGVPNNCHRFEYVVKLTVGKAAGGGQ